jgi:hypothetical protein
METILLAVLAEKRWDLFRWTKTKAEDSLRLFPELTVRPYIEANNLGEVCAHVHSHASQEPWFRKWITLFCQPVDSSARDTLEMLDDKDVFGWTAANVLRRQRLTKQELGKVASLLRHAPHATLRWRAAHVLGAFPTAEHTTLLLAHLKGDADEWVKYGCVRSLLEIAVRDRSLRTRIIDSICQRAAAIQEDAQDAQALKELQASLFVQEQAAPHEWTKADWKAAITPLVETFHDAAPTEAARERWQRTAYELRRLYA